MGIEVNYIFCINSVKLINIINLLRLYVIVQTIGYLDNKDNM